MYGFVLFLLYHYDSCTISGNFNQKVQLSIIQIAATWLQIKFIVCVINRVMCVLHIELNNTCLLKIHIRDTNNSDVTISCLTAKWLYYDCKFHCKGRREAWSEELHWLYKQLKKSCFNGSWVNCSASRTLKYANLYPYYCTNKMHHVIRRVGWPNIAAIYQCVMTYLECIYILLKQCCSPLSAIHISS